MKRAIITCGLGYGDEGKGATVDYLCRRFKSNLVVRYSGGPQCGHNVVLPDGRHHCFSQFGAGTFTGARTFIDRDVIVDPLAMIQEEQAIRNLGVWPQPGNMMVDCACPVVTPFHRAANRTLEKFRGRNRHGSCGVGVGETRRLWHKGIAITAGELKSNGVNNAVLDKLHVIRANLQEYLIYDNNVPRSSFIDWPESIYDVDKDLRETARRFSNWGIQSGCPSAEVAIFEGAQGALLDESEGEPPHTTWSTVTPRNAVELCNAMGTKYHVMGVTRCYLTRHGAGPLSTMTLPANRIYPGEHNQVHDWQGSFRCATLGSDSLGYSSSCCKIHSVSVNHLDHLDVFGLGSRSQMIDTISEICGKPVSIEGDGPTWENRKLSDHSQELLRT